MSPIQTATKQQNSSTLPDITILTRFASIPIIAYSLDTINGVLSSNEYTCSPYTTAKGLSHTAYKYSEPLQTRLAPLIVQADGYANMAVDAVESRYPYPFKAKPEEVADLVRERRQNATNYVTNSVSIANKKIDENIKTPAINVAQGIDQRFSPIVDYFEVAATRLNNSEAGPSTPPDAKYQYQRVLAISKSLKDNFYIYSNEQLKNLQAQNALVQRATETAQSITTLASSSITSAQGRIHNLSDNMLAELQKLHGVTASFQSSLQNQIPPKVQQTYGDLTNSLSEAVTELRGTIAMKDVSLQEKVNRVGQQVHGRVAPLLEAIRKGVSELLSHGKEAASQTASEANGMEGS